MEQLTIKRLLPAIQSFVTEAPTFRDTYRTKKTYCEQMAKSIKEIGRFAQNIINEFPNAQFRITGNYMYIDYGKGQAKFLINEVFYSFLLPSIIDTCYSVNKQIELN